jgi:hypothetical protein
VRARQKGDAISGRRLAAALTLAALAMGVAGSAGSGGGAPAEAASRPRVTLITDSVGGVLYWATAARDELAQGLDLKLETKACRRLVTVGCPAYGERPPSALETIRALGAELGALVVIDVGYNDRSDTYEPALNTVMQALLDAGVKHVIWVTLEETQEPWAENNAVIRTAPQRWPQLVVADWAPVAATNPSWFVDSAHMNADGAFGFARFLRPIILGVCGEPCRTPPPPPPPVRPRARMLVPTVDGGAVALRWHGNATARTYDVAVRDPRDAWRVRAARLAATSYRLRGRPGMRLAARVRARNVADVPGPWSAAQTIRFPAQHQ